MSRNRPYQANQERRNLDYSKSSSSTISDDEDESLMSEESLLDPEELSNYHQISSNNSNFDKKTYQDIRSQYEQKISYQSTAKRDVKYETVLPSGVPASNKIKTNCRVVCSLLVGVIACIVIAVHLNATENKSKSMKELNPFNDLKKNFPSQSKNFWRSLEIVLDSALNKSNSQPNIVLFMFNGNVFPDDLFNGIVKTTKFWLGNNVGPVELTKTDFLSEEINEDYGAVLNIYKPKLTKSRFMVVRDLDDIPANAAQAFHSFCDVYNPAVERAIIFFTMKVNDVVGVENATRIAEKLLTNVWSALELNALQPLIGRVTDDVLVIK